MQNKRRVVVTGLGVISSLGFGRNEFWKNIIAGKSGISEITSIETTDLKSHKGGEIKNFNKKEFLGNKSLVRKELGRASQFAIAATHLALEDSELKMDSSESGKIAVIIGTTMGESKAIEQIDDQWINQAEFKDDIPLLAMQYNTSAISANVAREFSIKGLGAIITTACASGNYCIGYGYDLIKKKLTEVALVGGSDAISRVAYIGFNRIFAMAPDICQPFDKNRKGMMMGEGSAILVLESLEHAIKRNAKIYAEISGYALSCDAYHMTIPSEPGIVRVIEKAIKNSSVSKEEIGYISAHGTGTLPNDKVECSAIGTIFGQLKKRIPVSSIKSMLGHTMGTASALEALSCVLAIYDDLIPPTINYKTPDPECDIDCVPNKSRKSIVNVALNNSFAFGGNNACTVFKRYKN